MLLRQLACITSSSESARTITELRFLLPGFPAESLPFGHLDIICGLEAVDIPTRGKSGLLSGPCYECLGYVRIQFECHAGKRFKLALSTVVGRWGWV